MRSKGRYNVKNTIRLCTYYLCQFKCVLVPIPMKKPLLQNREKTGLLVLLGSYIVVHVNNILTYGSTMYSPAES